MKKLIFTIIAGSIMTFSSFASIATPQPETSIAVTNSPSRQDRANILVTRLNEIKNIDKSNLTFSEKKILRQEVRDIKGKLKAMDGYIYISAGTLLLIIILLIILL